MNFPTNGELEENEFYDHIDDKYYQDAATEETTVSGQESALGGSRGVWLLVGKEKDSLLRLLLG